MLASLILRITFRNATLTEYFVAGAQAIYERDRDWEKVRITGPIEEDIKVYVSDVKLKYYFQRFRKTLLPL